MPSYEKELEKFEGLNTQVLGISVDSTFSHEAWQKSLGGISYPLLADFYPHGEVNEKYGVLRSEGISERSLFIIDKEGIIKFIDIHPIDKQPENAELFEIIEQINK